MVATGHRVQELDPIHPEATATIYRMGNRPHSTLSLLNNCCCLIYAQYPRCSYFYDCQSKPSTGLHFLFRQSSPNHFIKCALSLSSNDSGAKPTHHLNTNLSSSRNSLQKSAPKSMLTFSKPQNSPSSWSQKTTSTAAVRRQLSSAKVRQLCFAHAGSWQKKPHKSSTKSGS